MKSINKASRLSTRSMKDPLNILLCLAALSSTAKGFDNNADNNLAIYWGQNSYGGSHGRDTANWQKGLDFYCQDDTINAIPLAFLTDFGSKDKTGMPKIEFAGPSPSSLTAAIKTCQQKGKIITLSMGGETTGKMSFNNDDDGKQFADKIWDLYLGGVGGGASGKERPFGKDVILDGIDLDLEGGSQVGYVAFLKRLRDRMNGDTRKKYYITGAPQCPYPDANMGNIMNSVGFDAVYVQFYNNYCAVGNYPKNWNYATWHKWATQTSPNKNVKVYIGIPASSTSGGGYANLDLMKKIIKDHKGVYSSFGGVMMWDASEAYANGRFDLAVKKAMSGAAAAPAPASSSSKPAASPSPSSSSRASTPSAAVTTKQKEVPNPCAGIEAYSTKKLYKKGRLVVYKGKLWVAQWWTLNNVPTGKGVWAVKATCTK